MRFARWVFGIAGIYGTLLIAPMYFSAAQIGRSDPVLAFGCVDLLLGILFLVACWRTPVDMAK